MVQKRTSLLQEASVRRWLGAVQQEALLRNSVYLMLNTGTMGLFGFVFWIIVAHLYRPSQIGIASTLISCMNFIAYLSLLGVNSTFIRFLPKSKTRNEQIDTGLALVLLGALFAGAAFVLFAPSFAPKLTVVQQNIVFAAGFVVLCVGAAINLVTDSIFVAYRSAGYNLFVDGFVAGSIQLALPLLLVGVGSYGVFAAQGVAAASAALISVIYLMRKFAYRPKLTISRSVISKIKHYSAASYTTSLMAVLPTVILPVIILNKLGAASAGYYYLASMMANVLFAIAYAIAQSLFAEGSYDEERLSTLLKRSAKFLGITIVPASVVLALIGPFVLEFLGKTYGTNSSHVVIVLAASGPLVAASALGCVVLSVTKRMRSLIFVNTVYMITVCFSAYLLAQRGLVWVAGAWLIGHAVEAIVVYAVLAAQHQRLAVRVRMPA